MRIRESNPVSIAWAALVAMFIAMPAHATLYAVAHDRVTSSEKLVRVSIVDASITDNAATALANCCTFNGSLVASDDSNQTAYAVTPNPDAAQAWRLHRISLATGAAVTVDLPVGERVAALLRRPATATLFALSDAGAGLRLVTISNAGVVTPRGSTIAADCCAARVGVAALSADGTRIAFVARLKSANATTPLSMWVLDAASGAIVSSDELSHAPDVLFSNSGTTFSTIYHDAGTERVGSIGAGGTITPIGPGASTCCAMLSGVVARNASVLRVVARDIAAADLSLMEVDVVTGTFSTIGTLPSRYIVNGLVESAVDLASDLIFRDGFEVLPTTLSGKRDAGSDGELTTPGGFSTETVASSENVSIGGETALASAPKAAPFDIGANPKGGISAVALPVGGTAVWGLLIGLILLVVMRRRRWMR